jgi:hypothetical protein
MVPGRLGWGVETPEQVEGRAAKIAKAIYEQV